ncbi:Bug family tripartite tricarboxylate transporter substrate binding protein [Verticiella sediminum]|nr:tripartite tricarboxylate transporter substrate binding protein [Verticiella sediminum]
MRNAGLANLLKVSALLLCAASLLGAPARAEDWPTHAVRIIVPYPPGGNADGLARLVGDGLSRKLQANFVVENRPGGTGMVGTEAVARAEPDGYTLLLGTYSTFATLPVLSKMSPEPLDIIDVVGGVAGYVPVLAVSKQLNVATLEELIALAKGDPGKLTFGSVGVGASSHINGEILQHAAGIDMLHVPFKGSNQSVTALMGGQIDVLIDGVTVAAAKSGRVVPLAAFYKSRHEELPDVPTAEEAGVPVRLPTGPTFGVFAPKGVAPGIMAKLQDALESVTNDPEFHTKAVALSLTSDWTNAADFRRALEADLEFNRAFLPTIGLGTSQ